jgi:hypothetical protein
VDRIVDPDLLLGSSGDRPPILYVGPASLGLTNLLMTNPTTPVRTGLRSLEAHIQSALPFLPF